jgi:hypothetical protein
MVATSAGQSVASSESEVPFVPKLGPIQRSTSADQSVVSSESEVPFVAPASKSVSPSPNMPVQHMAMAPTPHIAENFLPPPVQYGEQGWSTRAQFQGYGYRDPQFSPYGLGYVPGPSNTYIPGYWMQPPPHRGYHGGYSDQPYTAYYQGTEQPGHSFFPKSGAAIANPSVPGPSDATTTYAPEDKA